MNDFRYILDKSSKKHSCPNCNKKTFVRYVDTATGSYLPLQYGRCDRESKCAYHLNPYSDGYAKTMQKKAEFQGIPFNGGNRSEFPNNWKPQRQPEPVFIPHEVLQQTLQPQRYSQNVFIQNLLNRVAFPFSANDVEKVISQYYIGTISHGYRAGAVTFPFIDIDSNIRAVQVKQFDNTNHTTGTGFLHSLIESHCKENNQPLPDWLQQYKTNDLKVSCLFGEHLLNRHPNNPIGLVEAPKTAIYCNLYFGFPDKPNSLVWLAVYNKSSFTFDKLKALQGRDVFVFPDLSKDGNTFAEWQHKAKEYEQRLTGTRFVFSDILERLAPNNDKANGYDIADYLIKLDWRKFRNRQPATKEDAVCEKCEKSESPKKHFFNYTPPPETTITKELAPPKEQLHNTEHKTIRYDNEKLTLFEVQRQWYVSMLEAQLKGEPIPPTPLKLGRCYSINDAKRAIEQHYKTLRDKTTKELTPYMERLQNIASLFVLTENSL